MTQTHKTYHRQQRGSPRRQTSSSPNETYQMIVLSGGKVYGILPDPANNNNSHTSEPRFVDVVVAGTKILTLLEPSKTHSFIDGLRSNSIKVLRINVENQIIMPGLIDVHVHAIGGGGEQGPYSRTPESRLSQLISAGLTTIVGILGTDGITRRVLNMMVFQHLCGQVVIGCQL
ncbi:unnamed protein product [Didymodactylos carnosus]|uniref:Amidohydrolase-related domain-containing protein n=1 Tax=Didymodactylos carnosus TaxID=1234261 RepID=A0A8S2EZQ8_9BILA|nr:unnamed protein product [Didymodactylos carnosus]CAF4108914.1 unnamed protein product [Didymodactylos carnosus]